MGKIKVINPITLNEEEVMVTNFSLGSGSSIIVDSYLSTSSTNPVENKIITNKVNELDGKINSKQDLLFSGFNIKTINGLSILGTGNITVSGSGDSSNSFVSVNYNPTTGVMTFTKGDGTTASIDLPLENIITSGRYDGVNKDIVLNLVSGEEILIPADDLVDIYTGSDGDNINVTIDANNVIKAVLKSGSILKSQLDVTLQNTIDGKQESLISGVNIKTINGVSLLGNGNIEITGGSGGDLSNYYTKSETYNKTQIDTEISALQTFINNVNSALNTKITNNENNINSIELDINSLRSDTDTNSDDIDAINIKFNNYYLKTEVDAELLQITNVFDTAMENGDASTLSESKLYTDSKIADVLGSTPETLNTLQELADALGDDPNFATTVSNQIGSKANKTDVYTKSEIDNKLDDKASIENVLVKDSTVEQTFTNTISGDFKGTLDANNTRIQNVSNPTNNKDAANKLYVDTIVKPSFIGSKQVWFNMTESQKNEYGPIQYFISY